MKGWLIGVVCLLVTTIQAQTTRLQLDKITHQINTHLESGIIEGGDKR